MSSTLQSTLTYIQQNDYASVIVISAVGYDYVLTFSKEIQYIWSKSWTRVSNLFILVRYVGLCSLVLAGLLGSSFIPGPAKVLCEIINLINSWTFVLFLGAADIVMILRVWAMYNQSRVILGILLTTFSLEVIITIALTCNPRGWSVSTVQIGNYSFCVLVPAHPIWDNVVSIFQITHGIVTCMLAIVQFVRQSLQMYRVTKRWQLNRYMNLLVKQGIFYFLAFFLLNLISVLNAWGKTPTGGWPLILVFILEYVPAYALSPRFIISIRELHAHDGQGRRGSGIDSGFGLSSGRGTVGMAMVFADAEPNEGSEDIEEVQREVEMTQVE